MLSILHRAWLPGEGSAANGRFVTRQVDVIARIEVLGADDRVETLAGTTFHPIWPLDRHDWVPHGEIGEGSSYSVPPVQPVF